MKKFVAALIISGIFCLCGCQSGTTGSRAELTSRSWNVQLDGGGKASLRFQGDNAFLTLENGGEQEIISGKYVADESTLVIFDDSVCQSYSFSYTPHGSTLTLSRDGGEIELSAPEN